MPDESDAPGLSMAAVANPPRHQRTEAVGPNGEPGSDRVPHPVLIPEHCSVDGALVIEQLLDKGPLGHHRAGGSSREHELMIQDSAGDGESAGAERRWTGAGKAPVGVGPPRCSDLKPLQC